MQPFFSKKAKKLKKDLHLWGEYGTIFEQFTRRRTASAVPISVPGPVECGGGAKFSNRRNEHVCDLYEAASIDGATAWQKFRHITVPMLMPAFTIVFFLTLSSSFKMLDENLALTGGDFGTRMLSLQILLTTRENTPPNYGMAQAQAVIFFILIATVSIIQVIVTKRKEIEA